MACVFPETGAAIDCKTNCQIIVDMTMHTALDSCFILVSPYATPKANGNIDLRESSLTATFTPIRSERA